MIIQIQNETGYTKDGNMKTITFSGDFVQIQVRMYLRLT
jgi:hypothetical protein